MKKLSQAIRRKKKEHLKNIIQHLRPRVTYNNNNKRKHSAPFLCSFFFRMTTNGLNINMLFLSWTKKKQFLFFLFFPPHPSRIRIKVEKKLFYEKKRAGKKKTNGGVYNVQIILRWNTCVKQIKANVFFSPPCLAVFFTPTFAIFFFFLF